MSEPKITESCGCVFCDVGLEPDNEIDGRPAHTHPTRGLGYSFCTHPEVLAAIRATPVSERENITQELADEAQERGAYDGK